MKKLKNKLPILLLITAMMMFFSCKKEKSDKEKKCNYAISYKVDGHLVTHSENAVHAEIWTAPHYPVNRKVYDIWTDDNPGFYFHCSASSQDEISYHVADWQNQVGSNITLNAVGLESDGLEFEITQEASEVGDIVRVTFSGTTATGKQITEGLICTKIEDKY